MCIRDRYMRGGVFYVYLCYGIHWLLNAVTGEQDKPQGVLIRACEGYPLSLIHI